MSATVRNRVGRSAKKTNRAPWPFNCTGFAARCEFSRLPRMAPVYAQLMRDGPAETHRFHAFVPGSWHISANPRREVNDSFALDPVDPHGEDGRPLRGIRTSSRDQGRTAGVGSVKRPSPGFGAMGETRR